jgi:hypothetical protein
VLSVVPNHDLPQLPVRLLLPRVMNKRKSLTFELTLSGISTALALICAVLYYYSPLGKLSFLALAAVALMLPLTCNHVRGALLAYAATSGLTIAIITPVPALPFIFLFGWQASVMGICDRYLKGKPYIALPIKAALFNAGLYGTVALYGIGDSVGNVLNKLNIAPRYWLIAIVGTVLYVIYDYCMQWIFKWLSRRLDKVTAKYRYSDFSKSITNQNGAQNPDTSPVDLDIFGEYGESAEYHTQEDAPTQNSVDSTDNPSREQDDPQQATDEKSDGERDYRHKDAQNAHTDQEK